MRVRWSTLCNDSLLSCHYYRNYEMPSQQSFLENTPLQNNIPRNMYNGDSVLIIVTEFCDILKSTSNTKASIEDKKIV